MKKHKLVLLSAVIIANLFGCGSSQQNSLETGKIDSTSNQISVSKTDRIEPKISPSIWVETKDAKVIADYYLLIFKDGKLKEHH